MNKKLGMAVAGAVMAFGATAANAGITIPAGDWTIDIGGNVNAYYSNVDTDTSIRVNGAKVSYRDPDDSNTVGTGLLPAALGIGGKTRQNDLDIAFQFTFFTGTSSGAGSSVYGNPGRSALSGNELNIRQAYLTFGDASWGTIKMGRDIGIFGSDAILSDMTLLGVGLGAPGGSSTLGRIGQGYIYADWKGQISYMSPNWNGFSFAAGVMEGWTDGQAGHDNNNLGFEAKASYEWAGDYAGKVWLGGVTQKHDGDTRLPIAAGVNNFDSYTARGWELGGKVNVGPVALVGYYYDGKGLDSQRPTVLGFGAAGTSGLQFLNGEKSDDDGGYVQAVWATPFGTKLGLSYGESQSDGDYNTPGADWKAETKSWIIGAYHPLTKSLNLVAEYVDAEKEGRATVPGLNVKNDTDIQQINLGAILFF
jgi:predicted porin